MRVVLTGVSCVGKTTVGRELAELLGANFFDLDHEIEMFFGTSIEPSVLMKVRHLPLDKLV